MCTFMLELCVYRLVWMSSEPVWLRLWFVDFFNPAWVYEIRPGSRDRDPSVQRGRPRQQFLPGDTRKTACRPGPPFTVRGGIRGRASPPLGDPTPQVIWGVWPPPATFPGPPPHAPRLTSPQGPLSLTPTAPCSVGARALTGRCLDTWLMTGMWQAVPLASRSSRPPGRCRRGGGAAHPRAG